MPHILYSAEVKGRGRRVCAEQHERDRSCLGIGSVCVDGVVTHFHCWAAARRSGRTDAESNDQNMQVSQNNVEWVKLHYSSQTSLVFSFLFHSKTHEPIRVAN